MLEDVNSEKNKINAEIFAEGMNDNAGISYVLDKLQEYESINDIDKQIACHELLYFRYKYYIYKYDLLRLYCTAGYQFQAEALKELIDEQIAQEAKEMRESMEAEQKGSKQNKNKKGCYVATCVYGSYDCPQVWTLRRYRDNFLARNPIGRTFIKTYYAISPTAVKLFGDYRWFRSILKKPLDRWVSELNNNGVENTPYNDQEV